VQRGLERGEIALLRLSAGERLVGYLYNFEFRGNAANYQSGFDYEGAKRHQTPGLTCHHYAIVDAASRGFDRYDFLAGDDRYKRSLATAAAGLDWLELGGGWRGWMLDHVTRSWG
jgi:CelD/BcsL family acetyltransferase involved in cellulose biosynthesis